jgi:uncharacterized protein (TIGR03435 family)
LRYSVQMLILGLATIAATAALATQASPQQKPSFEVASIKENTTNGPSDFVPRRSGDLIIMHNTRLWAIFNYAYRITQNYQREGDDRFPESSKWYDIQARAPSGATDDQARLMFQSLLEDRFKVKVHREIKEIPEFEMVTDKGKSKLTPSSSEELMKVTIEGKSIAQRSGTCGASLWLEGAHLVCHTVTMNTIAASVTGVMHAPIVDLTGLTGTYDLNIVYLPDERTLDSNAPPVASFEQALQEELGLKLQKVKGPVEVLVIDHIEKPTED